LFAAQPIRIQNNSNFAHAIEAYVSVPIVPNHKGILKAGVHAQDPNSLTIVQNAIKIMNSLFVKNVEQDLEGEN
jgi:hypothetical protein